MNLPLEDILLPEPPGLWPPAPGWIALALVAAGLLLTLVWLCWRSWRLRQARRAALAELRQLSISPALDGDSLNALLKRAALAYYDKTDVAALYGDPWWQFLQGAVSRSRQARIAPLQVLVDEQRFSRPGSDLDAEPVMRAARFWLRHALPPRRSRHG